MNEQKIKEAKYLSELQIRYSAFLISARILMGLLPETIQKIDDVTVGVIDMLKTDMNGMENQTKEICRYRALRKAGKKMLFFTKKPKQPKEKPLNRDGEKLYM